MKIKITEIQLYPAMVGYEKHGKVFLIKRNLFTHDISRGIDLSYWIYVKKYFLFWAYWSSISQSCFRVSTDTVEMAKQFIDNEYLLMSQVKYYSYD